MGLKTVQNSSFRGLKKKAQRFVLSSVVTKSSFVTIEFVTNSIETKFGFCCKKALSLALSQQNLVLSL